MAPQTHPTHVFPEGGVSVGGKATIKDQTETFEVPPGLSVNKSLGIGAYGIVAQFRDEATKSLVAIKKVGGLFNDLNDAKRVLREVRLLGAIDHDNIIKLPALEPRVASSDGLQV